MNPDRNCFESFLSVRGNVVLVDKTQIEYTGVGTVRLSCSLPSGDISVVLLCRVVCVPSLLKSLYSWNSVKLKGKFALIDDGILQVIRKLNRSVVINTLQSGNDVVLDLVSSESASLADDTDYEFWHATLGHQFTANMNRKLEEDEYLILDSPSNFTVIRVLCQNLCTTSRSQLSPNQQKWLS
jgi:hypothetical protein